jgi:ribosomal protein L14E/L6E/L27E
MAERRRMLERIEIPEVFEGEIIDPPFRMNTGADERQLVRDHELKLKVVESLPEAINIVKDIVSIFKIKEESKAELGRLDKEMDKIRVQTEDFVRREIAKRETQREKSEYARSMLRDLYSALNQMDASDGVKEKILDSFNTTIKIVLEEK